MGLFAVVREPDHDAYSLMGEIENEQVIEMQRMLGEERTRAGGTLSGGVHL